MGGYIYNNGHDLRPNNFVEEAETSTRANDELSMHVKAGTSAEGIIPPEEGSDLSTSSCEKIMDA